ncbi:hypothetical protein KUCAC02_004992, partial [Chaenocephalus aceratus]
TSEPQADYQPPRGCPSLDLTGALPCWLPFFTVPLVNLHLNWPLHCHIYGDELGCRGPGVTSKTPVPCYADDGIYANMRISK